MVICLSKHFSVYPSAEFETSLSTDGDGGEGGEEEDAGTQRGGETPGWREGKTAGTETGQAAVLSTMFAVPKTSVGVMWSWFWLSYCGKKIQRLLSQNNL